MRSMKSILLHGLVICFQWGLVNMERRAKMLNTDMTGLNARSAVVDYSTCSWTVSTSEGIADCPTNQIIVGLKCEGTNCSKVKLRCCNARGTHNGSVTAVVKGCLKGLASYVDEGTAVTDEVSYVNSERMLMEKAVHAFASGMECTENCKTLKVRGRRLQCGDVNYLIENEFMDGFCKWMQPFSSDSGNNPSECQKNYVVTGIRCSGFYCQTLQIHCCPFGHVCGLGTYGDNRNCKYCPIGRYGNSLGLTASVCTADCPKGRYGSSIGIISEKCTAMCPKGKYNDKLGAHAETNCVECPAGRYGDQMGLTTSDCTAPCPKGTYREKTGAKSIKDCLLCPLETYEATTGSTKCKSCPVGKYYEHFGATSPDYCKACPPSYRGNQCVGGARAVGG